ncbi:hypothetical protein MAR_001652 [Mya arenaria]|uniref:Uncharacterized protein n=1 Tax=Mya arenaria TaxID=6604 RepID=A0ABY7FEL4_MYAAR|nr:hypothetical protein MAR_001652 [Mya arenaria]
MVMKGPFDYWQTTIHAYRQKKIESLRVGGDNETKENEQMLKDGMADKAKGLIGLISRPILQNHG